MGKILMIADELDKDLERFKFLRKCMEVHEVADIQGALLHLTTFSYQIVLVVLQQKIEILCRLIITIRKLTDIPILVFISDNTKERMQIIKAGADVALPFSCRREEIELQIFALTRRHEQLEHSTKNEDDILEIGPLRMKRQEYSAFWEQRKMELTRREYDFLYLLAATPCRVYTFAQIYRMVWKEEPQGDIANIIWCLVYRLKKKLKNIDVRAADIICSVKEIGYCLKIDDE